MDIADRRAERISAAEPVEKARPRHRDAAKAIAGGGCKAIAGQGNRWSRIDTRCRFECGPQKRRITVERRTESLRIVGEQCNRFGRAAQTFDKAGDNPHRSVVTRREINSRGIPQMGLRNASTIAHCLSIRPVSETMGLGGGGSS